LTDKVKYNVHMADFFLNCASQRCNELFWQCYRKRYFVSTLSNWGGILQKLRGIGLDWIVQCFMSPPTQYRLNGRRFLQVKRPNQQYQSTQNTANPLVYTNMGWEYVAPTEGRVARPERRWGCRRGTPDL